jgi:hypothetical protein
VRKERNVSAQAGIRRSTSPFETARRAPWATAFIAAIAVGAAVFLISLVNLATPWRADAREAWSIALLVLFICGGMASLTPQSGAAGAAARSPRRAWALARPWLFALGLAAGCGLAVGFSDLNLWHTAAGTAFAHAMLQASLVALVGPVHALSRQPAD